MPAGDLATGSVLSTVRFDATAPLLRPSQGEGYHWRRCWRTCSPSQKQVRGEEECTLGAAAPTADLGAVLCSPPSLPSLVRSCGGRGASSPPLTRRKGCWSSTALFQKHGFELAATNRGAGGTHPRAGQRVAAHPASTRWRRGSRESPPATSPLFRSSRPRGLMPLFRVRRELAAVPLLQPSQGPTTRSPRRRGDHLRAVLPAPTHLLSLPLGGADSRAVAVALPHP